MAPILHEPTSPRITRAAPPVCHLRVKIDAYCTVGVSRLDPVHVAIPGYFAVTGLIRESRLQEIPGYWLSQSPFPLS
jgi:hypothetical protein